MCKIPFFLSLFLLLLINFCSAQEVISAAGMSAENGGYQLSWTVGEPVIKTVTNGTSTLTQGFHQSKLTITAIDQLAIGELELNVYPNPFSEELTIEMVKNEQSMGIKLVVYDITGKQLLQSEIGHQIEKIAMQSYPSGNYLLRFFSEKMVPIQTFKVVKAD
jgi:hypothetical protein